MSIWLLGIEMVMRTVALCLLMRGGIPGLSLVMAFEDKHPMSLDELWGFGTIVDLAG